MIALLAEPSQSGGFLGFSVGRWGFLLLNLLILAGISYLLLQVWNGRTRALEIWLADERHLAWLLVFSISSFCLALPAALGNLQPVRDFPYFGRLRPTLIWITLAGAQIGLSLLFVLRKAILVWLRGFFPLDSSTPAAGAEKRSTYLAMAGLGLAYAAIQGASYLRVRAALWLPDSIDYIYPTSFPWSDSRLWTGTKPWGAAVLYKLTGSSPVTIDAVQTILSTLAWLCLALAFSRLIRSGWLKISAYAFTLGFSLAPPVQLWNHIIQSESLSLSLFVFILSTWLSLLRRWHWGKLLALILLFGWWTGTRETNIYLGMIVAGIVTLVGIFHRRQRFYWGVSLVLVLFGYLNLQISEIPTIPRWLYPLTNTLLNRILPNEEFFSYFQARGLDASPELMALSGGLAHSGNFAVFNDPSLSYVEDWLYQKGKQTYIHFLLDHPLYALTAPWQNVHESLAPDVIAGYAPERYQPFAKWIFENLFFPGSPWLLLSLALVTIAITLTAKPWQGSVAFWLLIGLLALFFPHFYLVWHGDAAEVGRHAIQASIQLRLALWLLLFLSLDTIMNHDPRI